MVRGWGVGSAVCFYSWVEREREEAGRKHETQTCAYPVVGVSEGVGVGGPI